MICLDSILMQNCVFGLGSNIFSIFSMGSFLMSVIITIGFTLVDVASHLIGRCNALTFVVESAIILPGDVGPQPLSSISFLILIFGLAAPLNCFNMFSANEVDVIWVYPGDVPTAPDCPCSGCWLVRQTFAELYGMPAFWCDWPVAAGKLVLLSTANPVWATVPLCGTCWKFCWCWPIFCCCCCCCLNCCWWWTIILYWFSNCLYTFCSCGVKLSRRFWRFCSICICCVDK